MIPEGDHSSNPIPLVSVIVPSYNHAPFLPRRLDSILNQTFRDFELIVLDDCSPDNSRDILRDYANRFPMRLILNEKNSGSPFAQWRRGALLAKGRYLWIAESDDVANPKLLENLVNVMTKHPQVGLAYCQSLQIDANNARIHKKYHEGSERPGSERWSSDFVNSGKDEVARWLILLNSIPNASAVVVRRDIFLEASEGAENYRIAGDWRTWGRMLLASDVAFVAEPLNFHRTHATSVRSSHRRGAACVEDLMAQAHICTLIAIPAKTRARALASTFNRVWNCMRTPDFVPYNTWFTELVIHGTQIHPSARRRLAWLRIKRRILFLRPGVRFVRTVFKTTK